jgi:hypothetical protein
VLGDIFGKHYEVLVIDMSDTLLKLGVLELTMEGGVVKTCRKRENGAGLGVPEDNSTASDITIVIDCLRRKLISREFNKCKLNYI